jgi:hypothetical protein
MGFTATFPGKSPEVSSAGGNLSLCVARTVAEVEELRGIWQAWQDHPGSVIDTYLDWFKEDPASRPHVLVVRRDGSPDCLLIGKHLRKAVISRVARLLHSDARVLYFVQGGLLGNASAENCEFLLRAVLAQLRDGEASAAEFFGLPTDSPLYRAAMRVPAFFCRDHFPVTTIHRYLVLPDSFQEFLNSLPAKERQNIKYRHNRLIKKFSGKVRLSRFCEEREVEALVAAAEEIAKKPISGPSVADLPSPKQRACAQKPAPALFVHTFFISRRILAPSSLPAGTEEFFTAHTRAMTRSTPNIPSAGIS